MHISAQIQVGQRAWRSQWVLMVTLGTSAWLAPESFLHLYQGVVTWAHHGDRMHVWDLRGHLAGSSGCCGYVQGWACCCSCRQNPPGGPCLTSGFHCQPTGSWPFLFAWSLSSALEAQVWGSYTSLQLDGQGSGGPDTHTSLQHRAADGAPVPTSWRRGKEGMSSLSCPRNPGCGGEGARGASVSSNPGSPGSACSSAWRDLEPPFSRGRLCGCAFLCGSFSQYPCVSDCMSLDAAWCP